MIEFAFVDDIHRALRTHHRDFRGGPGEIGVGANVLAGHDAIGAAVGFARDHRDFRHGGFGESEEQFRAVPDDAAKLLLRAGQKSRDVLERDQRNIERVAETHEARAFHAKR